MLNIIIVDDDEIIRKGIVDDIDWEKHGIQIAGTARNGMEGLELVKELKPEIVLTDIKMPLMDGLEMIDKALEFMPHLKIVFLTAYEDFEYAQKSLRLKANDYILKYAAKDEILAAILKARDEWIHDRKIRESLYHSNVLEINRFFGGLLSTMVNEPMVKAHAGTLGIHLAGENFCVAVIGIDHHGSFSRFDQKSDDELALHSIVNVTGEILYTYGMGFVFTNFTNCINILFNCSPHKSSNEMIYNILEEIMVNIKKYLKISVSIGVGDTVAGVSNINASYNEAVKALEMRGIVNKTGIIPIESVRFNENSQLSVFKKIISYVEANYTTNVTLNDIADVVHVSHTYICTLFRKYKNCTLSEYLIGQRIGKAKELLKNTDMKSYEVSEMIGYTNPQYFSILFKKRTGMTPSEFKKSPTS